MLLLISLFSVSLFYIIDFFHIQLGCKYILRCVISVVLSYYCAFCCSNFTDYEHYTTFYHYIDTITIGLNTILDRSGFSITEPGYLLLAILSSKVGLSYTGFLFLLLIPTNMLLLSFFSQTKYGALSLLMFLSTAFYVQQANITRQMIAVSIFFYSLKYLKNRELKKYSISIIIAGTFHLTSLLLFVFYFLNPKKSKYKLLLIFWGISLCFAIRLIPANILLDIMNRLYLSYYSNYFTTKIETMAYEPRWLYNIIVLGAFIVLPRIKDRKYILIFNLFVLGMIFDNLKVAMPIFYRLSYYFVPLIVIVVPLMFQCLFKNKNPINIKFFKIILFVLFIRAIYFLAIVKEVVILPFSAIFN